MRVLLSLILMVLLVSQPSHALFIGKQPASSTSPQLNAAANKLAAGDIEGARKGFDAVLAADPNNSNAMLGLADIALLEKKSALVKQWLARAVSADPKNAAVQTAWGRYLYMSQEFDQAVIHFQQAAKLDPNLAAPHIELAALHLSHFNQPKKAIQYYTQAIKLAPNNLDIRYALASILSSTNQFNPAIEQLDWVTSNYPSLSYPHQLKGTILKGHGFPKKALAAFKRALEIDPKLIQAHWARGEIFLESKRYQDAIDEYRKILEIESEHAFALSRIGYVFQLNNKFATAEKYYRRAIKSDPKLALAYNNLAYGVVKLEGRQGEALNWAKKATALQPDNPDFIETLALAYEANGEKKRAIKQYEALLEQHPEYSKANKIKSRIVKLNN